MGFFQTSGILNRKGFFGGAAKEFLPTDIAGLQLWLDATTGLFDATTGGSAVTTDGSAVARWEDQSGKNNHFTQTTLNKRPIIKAAHKNSKNTLFFDGSDDDLRATFSVNAPFTTIAVAYPSLNGGGSYRIVLTGNNNGFAFGYDNVPRAFFYTSTGSQASRSRPADYELYIAALNGASSEFLINNNFNGAWSVANTNISDMRLATNYSAFYQNYFAEVLIYDSVLSNNNITSIKKYLNDKWNIY